jgi:transcriptional regulator with XRE-family HTH domain
VELIIMALTYVRSLIEQLKFLGWEQKDIAKRLGVSKAAVSLWATGKRPVPKRHEAPLIRLVIEALQQDSAAMEAELDGLAVGANDAPREEQERRFSLMRKWEERLEQLNAYSDAWLKELYVTRGKCAEAIQLSFEILGSPYAKEDPLTMSREDRARLKNACRLLMLHFDYLDQYDNVPVRLGARDPSPGFKGTPQENIQQLCNWFNVGFKGEE